MIGDASFHRGSHADRLDERGRSCSKRSAARNGCFQVPQFFAETFVSRVSLRIGIRIVRF